MRKFEIFDLSGDAGIRAWGRDIPELFTNAAEALFSLITDPAPVSKPETRDVSVQADSLDSLLVAWLNELVFLFDTYGFLAREVSVRSCSCVPSEPCAISAAVSGEAFDPGRHARKLLPKAATYHKLKVAKDNGSWTAEVIIDI